MNAQATSDDLVVGIIGAGAMGRGVAQVSAASGAHTLIFDAADGAAAEARSYISKMFGRLVEKGRMEAADAEASSARIEEAGSIAGLVDCDVVIEAIIEKRDIKQDVFRQLEDVVREDTILASNTSSISIASIASVCRHRSRVAGMHFFNPVPLMKLVEVIRAPDTSREVVEFLTALGKRFGRVPVVVGDSPGFLVNLGGRAYVTEGLRIAHEGVASPAQIDAVMRDSHGFRMGPFELMDFTGIDVNFPVSEIVYQGYFHDRRLATTPLHRLMMESGRLGRKTGAGFYDYAEDGSRLGGEDVEAVLGEPVVKVVPVDDSRNDALADLFIQAGADVLSEDDGVSTLVAAPMGEDCTGVAHRLGLDAHRLVAIDLSGSLDKRLTIMTAPGASDGVAAGVAARLAEGELAVTAIADSPGFIGQRIRAMVANLGCEMAQIGVASPADIDTAMTLGLNYPEGPLAMCDSVGPDVVFGILEHIKAITGDDRYRPSQWLRRRALLGLSAADSG